MAYLLKKWPIYNLFEEKAYLSIKSEVMASIANLKKWPIKINYLAPLSDFFPLPAGHKGDKFFSALLVPTQYGICDSYGPLFG
jgi:hypothetical protein